MPSKRFTPEQIIPKLREAEVEQAKCRTVAQACKKIGVTDQIYYRWRKEYGGLGMDQAKRLKELEKENTRLKSYWPKLSWTKPFSKRRHRETDQPGQASSDRRIRAERAGPGQGFREKGLSCVGTTPFDPASHAACAGR